MISLIARCFPNRPIIYSIAWVAWFSILWILSSHSNVAPDGPDIPYFDKIAHFGYFLGGAGLLMAWIRLKKLSDKAKELPPQWKSWLIVVGVSGIVGIIDEFHQSFTPGRQGNDFSDWSADVLGSMMGAWIMLKIMQHKAPSK